MGFIFKPWKKLSLFTRIMIGFVLGIIAGLILGDRASMFNFLGVILTNLLTMVVGPLVFSLLVCAAAEMGDAKKLGRIGVKAVLTFLISTAFAIVLGLAMSNLLNIGSGVRIESVGAVAEVAEEVSMLDTLVGIIPRNIFASLTNQNLLQIIFFALLLGFTLMKIGEPGKPLLNFFKSSEKTMKGDRKSVV